MDNKVVWEDLENMVIKRHQESLDVWNKAQEIVNRVMPRFEVASPLQMTLDYIFMQMYKSHSSAYLLCVNGQTEDAGAVLYRMIRNYIQTYYLCYGDNGDESEKERIKKYIAYFSTPAKEEMLIDSMLLDSECRKEFKDFLRDNAQGLRILRGENNWWGNKSVEKLAMDLRLGSQIVADLNLSQKFSNYAFASVIMGKSNISQANAERFFDNLIIASSIYLLKFADMWNQTFQMLEKEDIALVISEGEDLLRKISLPSEEEV